MNPQSQKIQLLADLVLPLVGYYFWGWNIYFILFFFALDIVAQVYFAFLKSKKIATFQQTKYPIPHLTVSLMGYGVVSVLLVYSLPFIVKGSDFYKELNSFLTYKEMGVPQLILLFPLVIVGGYMNYKVTFLLPKKFASESIYRIWKDQLVTCCSILIVILLFVAVTFFFVLPESVYIWSMLVIIALYKFYIPKIK
jgi:hypothetical protein